MIDHLDHLVLTTADIDACKDFYVRVLGMTLNAFVRGVWHFASAIRKSTSMSAARSSSPRPICQCRVRWICVSSPPSRWSR